MLNSQPGQLSFAQLFDTLPDAVIYFRAVQNEQEQVVDFVVDYVNRKTDQYTQGYYSATVGLSLRHDSNLAPALRESQFLTVRTVFETGQSTAQEYYSETLAEWLCRSSTKAGDGVLTITRIVTAYKQVEAELQQQTDQLNQQNALLQSILDTSLSNVFVYEAIRDETPDGQPGPIRDFIIRMVNEQARQDTINWMGNDPTGKTLLSINPQSRQTGQFDLCCQVTETGQSIQTEQFYPAVQRWFNTSITRLNDGCVVTGIDITQQKRVAQEVDQQKSLLNGVVNHVELGLLLFEPVRHETAGIVDLRFRLANDKAAQILGKRVADLTDRPLLEIFPGVGEFTFPGSATHESLLTHYIRQIRQGGTSSYEFLYDRDGLNMWVQATANALTNQEGLVVSFADITDSKQNQQVIEQTIRQNRQQAELLNSVLNSSQNGIMSFEAIRNAANVITDFQFRTINQASEQIVGVAIETMLNTTLLSVFPGNVDSGLFDLYVHTTNSGEPTRTEVYYNHDGLDFWLDISVRQLGDGFVVTFTDVSLVKRAARAVEQAAAVTERQAELLNTVLDNSQTAISLHEAIRDTLGQIVDFRAVLANSRAMSMWGSRAEGVMSQPFFAISSPEQQTYDFPKYVRVVETGEPDLAEFSIGEQRLLRLTAKSGDGMVISNIDITEIHRLRQQLEASVIDLQRSNQNLEQFAYVASHDLQEPLRKIQAFGDMIQTQYAPLLGPQGTDMIHRMQSAAARMQMLIKDVLAYSRIAIRREESERVDLNDVMKEVLENLETAIADKQAIVTVDPLPVVLGDAPQLRQLGQNLISNALKFSRPDIIPQLAVLCRTVRGCDAGIIVAKADADRWFYLIEFRDNGIGFEPHHAERIFQVFQRLHGRGSYEGTGIGLAIVHKVVENHQGYIEAEGKPGQGATFRIMLPVAD